MFHLRSSLLSPLLLAGTLAAATGCYVGPGYVEARVAPIVVEGYPYTYYDGRVVYLIGDHWYLRRRDAWVYLGPEPPELREFRVTWRHEHEHEHGHGRYGYPRARERSVHVYPQAHSYRRARRWNEHRKGHSQARYREHENHESRR